jgi:hypothetical protein
MSDVQIVSADAWRNGWRDEGHVPYGTVFADETDFSENQTMEGIREGAVPAVDWRGVDQVDTVPGPAKRKPGRPRKTEG